MFDLDARDVKVDPQVRDALIKTDTESAGEQSSRVNNNKNQDLLPIHHQNTDVDGEGDEDGDDDDEVVVKSPTTATVALQRGANPITKSFFATQAEVVVSPKSTGIHQFHVD